jgi:signal transduction histidine kinase
MILNKKSLFRGIFFFNPISYKKGTKWRVKKVGVWLLSVTVLLLISLIICLIYIIYLRSAHITSMNQDFKREVSKHLLAEESKQKLEIALLQGQKLQAIGTLAGGIAHDFNNLLYAIKGYVEMAREDVEKDSLVYKNLGKVLEAGQRGQDLVARILAFGRRQKQQELKPIEVKTMIDSILALLRPTIPASVEIDFKCNIDQLIIKGNQTQLHQVIMNVINNAVDAMDGEGKIILTLDQISAENVFLHQFPNMMHFNYCKIDITDTGHGMDAITIERIFEPFFTTKEVGKGTGLGLSTAHSIMEQHQGKITVASQLGQGTTFTLLFPEYENINITQETSHGEYSAG